MLNERRDDLFRSADITERIRDNKGFEPGERLERNISDQVCTDSLDIDPTLMRDGNRGGPIDGRIRDREIDFMLRWNAALEGDAVGFGDDVSLAMLDEIKPFFFGKSGFQVRGFTDKPRFSFFADT